MAENTFINTIRKTYITVIDRVKGKEHTSPLERSKNILTQLKTQGEHALKRVQEIGVKEAFLTMGTPSEITHLSYEEVIKKERNALKVEKHSKKQTTVNTTTIKSTDKKETIKKKETKSKTKKTVLKKSTKKPKMTKREEKIAHYAKDIKKHYGEVDTAFLTLIVKNLGPSIYRKKAASVSCSDTKELATVRRNFLVNKLGLDASKEVLDAAIEDVCEELKDAKQKYRATFYYALAKKFKKESALS